MSKLAFLFPGQGNNNAELVDDLLERRHLLDEQDLCKRFGISDLAELRSFTDDRLNANVCSSLLTVAASLALYDEHRARFGTPDILLGYSVGQWTALHVAGVLERQPLLDTIVARGRMMDDAVAGTASSMVTVIGLDEPTVRAVISRLHDAENPCHLSNLNCFGNCSVAFTVAKRDEVVEAFRSAGASRVVPLNVSGGWHSPFLAQAQGRFMHFLGNVQLTLPALPVLDNVTGELLPTDPDAMRSRLSQHVTHPVRWEDCVNFAIGAGVSKFIEFGRAKMLCKFGFFISRDATFQVTG